MRIALFSSDIERDNGYGNITYELCTALSKNKDIIPVLFLPKSSKKPAEKTAFEIRYVLPEYIFRIRNRNAIPYMFQNIDLRGFDLVHSLFEFPYSFLAARLAKKYNIPFIMGSQGTYGVLPLTYFPEKYFAMWAYRQAREIIVPSAFTREKILEYSGQSYPISIIHNGVNFSRFKDGPDISDLKRKYGDKKILLTVGAVKNRKGQDIVIRALPEVIKRHPNALYIIAGGGTWRPYLEKIVDGMNLNKHVEFTGRLEDAEIVKYFHLSKIYVHTPRVTNLNFEGFGIVYLEASACGKPIVATDAGGIRDAVIDGKTGLIAPDEDVAGIAERIIRLLDDPALSRTLGGNGKEYARDHDWSNIVKKFISKYHKYAK